METTVAPTDARDNSRFPDGYAAYAFTGAKPPRYSQEPATPPAATDAALIPDSVVDGFSAGRLAVRAVSVRGDRHRHDGSPRQDAVAAALLGEASDGVVLGAVADGVGSAPLSHHGAAQACAAAIAALTTRSDAVRRALSDGDEDRVRFEAHEAVREIADEIAAAARRLNATPAALATTLRVVLVPTATPGWCAAFDVGDGATYRLTATGWQSTTTSRSPGGGGPIHSTAVHALPEQIFALRCAMWRPEPGETVVVCTDGLSEPLRDAEFAEYLAGQWTSGDIPGTLKFLWQAQSRLRSYDDDRAVVCVWRHNQPSPAV